MATAETPLPRKEQSGPTPQKQVSRATVQPGAANPERHPLIIRQQEQIEPMIGDPDWEKFLGDLAEAEKFMNEIVVIRIQKTTDKNAANHVPLSVNGLTHPVVRGIPTPVKRKFVEVLARMKESSYDQHFPNPAELDRYEMIETEALAYPFEIIRDDNPRGFEWLQRILAERG